MPDKTYVFNEKTLWNALDVWIAQEATTRSQNQDDLPILKVAIPWFMKHLNQTGSVYMFSEKLLVDELKQWEKIQLSNYPHQSMRIEETCKLLLDFFQSKVVIEHKMLIV